MNMSPPPPAITPRFLLILVMVLAALAAFAIAEMAQRQDRLPGPPTGLRIVPTPRAQP